jgi:hypothetical protein
LSEFFKRRDNFGSKSRWENNIKMIVKEMGREDVSYPKILLRDGFL